MDRSEERGGVGVMSMGGGLVVVGLVGGERGRRRLREVKSFMEAKPDRRSSRLLEEHVKSDVRSESSGEGVIVITDVVPKIWLRVGVLHKFNIGDGRPYNLRIGGEGGV